MSLWWHLIRSLVPLPPDAAVATAAGASAAGLPPPAGFHRFATPPPPPHVWAGGDAGAGSSAAADPHAAALAATPPPRGDDAPPPPRGEYPPRVAPPRPRPRPRPPPPRLAGGVGGSAFRTEGPGERERLRFSAGDVKRLSAGLVPLAPRLKEGGVDGPPPLAAAPAKAAGIRRLLPPPRPRALADRSKAGRPSPRPRLAPRLTLGGPPPPDRSKVLAWNSLGPE